VVVAVGLTVLGALEVLAAAETEAALPHRQARLWGPLIQVVVEAAAQVVAVVVETAAPALSS
jgi:hypothetical protein